MDESDKEQIVSIEKEALTSSFAELNSKDGFYHNPFARIKVATIQDENGNEVIIGFVHYWITFDSATIAQIAVKKQFKRQGVANALLKIMNEDCLFNNARSITLEVRVDNIPAISFYEKDGFKKVAIKEHYYEDGTDAIYMIKEVN